MILDNVLKRKEQLIKNLRNRNIDESIISDTVSDIERRRKRHQDNEGIDGLYETDLKWLEPLLEGNFISFKGFRSQIFPMDYEEIERSDFDFLPLSEDIKRKLPEGLLCLNVHLPDGVDISSDTIFNETEVFFDQHFPELHFHYFVIRSWIVYPGMKKILKETSKIAKFMDHFESLAVSDTNKVQPYFRIFGMSDINEIQSQEWQTSLQKNALNNLDALGVSFSVRRYKK